MQIVFLRTDSDAYVSAHYVTWRQMCGNAGSDGCIMAREISEIIKKLYRFTGSYVFPSPFVQIVWVVRVKFAAKSYLSCRVITFFLSFPSSLARTSLVLQRLEPPPGLRWKKSAWGFPPHTPGRSKTCTTRKLRDAISRMRGDHRRIGWTVMFPSFLVSWHVVRAVRIVRIKFAASRISRIITFPSESALSIIRKKYSKIFFIIVFLLLWIILSISVCCV